MPTPPDLERDAGPSKGLVRHGPLWALTHDQIQMDIPVYRGHLPQIWIENDQFVIESQSFRYVIETSNKIKRKSADPMAVLFKLCRRMKSDAVAATYGVQ